MAGFIRRVNEHTNICKSIGLLVVCVTFAHAYVVPATFTFEGTVDKIHAEPQIEFQVGDDPGEKVLFNVLDTGINSTTEMSVSSCTFSSYCQKDANVYSDVGYVKVERRRFDYRVNASLDKNVFSLWPGSDWFPTLSNFVYCPSRSGFMISQTLSDDLRCYDDVREINDRQWKDCSVSPFECDIAADVNGDSTITINLKPASVHVEVSSDLYALPGPYKLTIGDFWLEFDKQTTISLSQLERKLMVENANLPNKTIHLGVIGANVAYTWNPANSKIYVNRAWDHDGHILYIDFIIGGFLLYFLKVWFSWTQKLHSNDAEFSKFGSKLLLCLEILGSGGSAAVVGLHTFDRSLGERIFRVSELFSPESAQVFSYVLCSVVFCQFVLHGLAILHFPSSIATRKYCFECNVTFALSLLILNTYKVGFLNVLLALIGVFLLFRRQRALYRVDQPYLFFVFYFVLVIYATAVMFPPFIQSMSGFSGNIPLASIYASVLVILGPGMFSEATA